jgi:molybdate transport system permease protein
LAKLALCPLGVMLLLVAGSLCSLIFQLEPDILRSMPGDPELRFALLFSLATSSCSLLLALIIAIPAAWALTRLDFPGRGLINVLLDLPLVTPPLVVGLGLLLLLGQQGPFSPALSGLLFSPAGVIIAQTYVASAILLRAASGAFSAIESGYLLTAQNLGLTPLKTLILVEIPLCWPSLLSGCVLAFSRACGEFGATLMLAGAVRLKTETLPVAVYLNIATGDFSRAIGCALVLILLAGVLLLVLRGLRYLGGSRSAARG